MSKHSNTDSFLAFINTLFGETTGPINLCTLRNNAGGAGATITSSDSDALTKFVVKGDQQGWGTYVCVSTMVDDKRHHAKDSINEIPSLHIDIDCKDLAIDSKDDVVRKLKGLASPNGDAFAPSLLTDSGNGIHAYWIFKEAFILTPDDRVEIIDRVEAALKLLCDLVGGDIKVTQPSAVMRLPGTHNTKNEGQNHLVTIVWQSDDIRYELDDIEEYLTELAPIILRKVRPQAKTVGQDDSMAARYERILKEIGYKPPLNVKERLGQMMLGGEGDSSIHETQVQVSASLLGKGETIDNIVALLMEATRSAAGKYGDHWNWTRGKKSEQGRLRYMCETWLEKRAKDGPKKQRTNNSKSNGGGSSSSKQDRSGSQSSGTFAQSTTGPATVKDKTKDDDEPFYITVAKAFFVDLEVMHWDLQIFVDKKGNENLWRYEDGLWILMINSDAWLDGRIEDLIQRALKSYKRSSNRVCSEARKYILRSPNVRKMQLETFDNHGMIPVRGNLIDPRTSKVRPIKKEDYCTWTLDIEFDPDAKCPWWLQMLEDVFEDKCDEDKQENIILLQDFGGASLVNKKGKGLRRALVPYGESNSGKTSVVEVMSGMISTDPITTPIADLNSTHGTQSFRERKPWVLQEAFNQSVWHVSDKAKQILSGEPFEINPKGKNAIAVRFTSPAYWPTNHAPKFKEATKAIINRITVIRMTSEFRIDEERGTMIEARKHGYDEPQHFVLDTEKSGILNWMLEGAKRVLPRGRYLDTKEGLKVLRDIRRDSNYAVGYIGDCFDFDGGTSRNGAVERESIARLYQVRRCEKIA